MATATKQQQQSAPLPEGVDEFSFGAIRARLAEPIEPHYILTKNLGGRNINYVNVTDLKDILDARVPVWESHVTDVKQIGENLCVIVRLTIHTTEGNFSQDGTGLELLAVNSYGDPFSNAYAQAFRRACEGFALGRELWRKKDHGHAATSAGGSAQASAPRRQNVKPTQGKADNAHEPATSAQLVLLKRKLDENDINIAAWLADEFPDVQDVSQLSKRATSYLLDTLMS